MKLTASLTLHPDPDTARLLVRTLERANAAAGWISREAWRMKCFNRDRLHHLVYHRVRSRFGLPSQMAVRAVSKVADAYKLDASRRRRFKARGAVAYDARILTFKPGDLVSIATLEGRKLVRFSCGPLQHEMLAGGRGEADLIVRGKQVHLNVACEVERPETAEARDVTGVDLGIVNLATTSDGERFTGEEVERARVRHRTLRRSLQRRAAALKSQGERPKNVRRRLKRLAGKQARFQRDVNHRISKRLVDLAVDTKRAVALEDLKGIRERARLGKEQRERMGNWGFAQLAVFVGYKAARVGVEVVIVDARHTSRMCSLCGHVSKANRASQAEFACRARGCGHREHADVNAARNIQARGRVNARKVAESHRDTLVA